MPPFRITARFFFLTYSNVLQQSPEFPAESEGQLEQLLDVLWSREPEYVCVSREAHEDGSPHFHAFVSFANRRDVANPRYFDWGDIHCKIERARDPAASVTYAKKDGVYLERGTCPEFRKTKGSDRPAADTIIASAADMGRLEFLGWAAECAVQYAPIIWELSHRDRSKTIYPDTPVWDPGPSPFRTWIESRVRTPLRSFVVVGPSGAGKTCWVKMQCTKPALWVTHLDDLRDFDPELHRSIVFDDLTFTHLPGVTQINLVDLYEPRTIHLRYRNVSLPAGLEKWFTCNECPLDIILPQIARRVDYYHFTMASIQ